MRPQNRLQFILISGSPVLVSLQQEGSIWRWWKTVFVMSNRLQNFVLVAVIAENPVLHMYVVGNGSNVFSALTDISGYSALVLIQKPAREVCSNTLLQSPSFAISINWSSSCTTSGSGHWQMGCGSTHLFAVELWRMGSEVRIHLKANKVIAHQLRENGPCLSLSQNPH